MNIQIQITPFEYALACVGMGIRSHRPAQSTITTPQSATPAAEPEAAPAAPAETPQELDLTC